LGATPHAKRERRTGERKIPDAHPVAELRAALIRDVAQFDEVLSGRWNFVRETGVGGEAWIIVAIDEFLALCIEQAHDRIKRRAKSVGDDFDGDPLTFLRRELEIVKTQLVGAAIHGHGQLQQLCSRDRFVCVTADDARQVVNHQQVQTRNTIGSDQSHRANAGRDLFPKREPDGGLAGLVAVRVDHCFGGKARPQLSRAREVLAGKNDTRRFARPDSRRRFQTESGALGKTKTGGQNQGEYC